MVDNPNTDYYSPAKGTLTGFDAASVPTANPDIVQTGWSIDQLRSYLLNEHGQNFPTNEWVRMVDALINDHVQDFNNPHRLTLSQITSNFVRDILASVTPGTPPPIAPFYAYDTACALPLGDIFPATYSNTNILRMTEGGQFVDPSTELEIFGIDAVTNQPGIPLFSSLTNVIPANWATQSSTLVNTTLTNTTHPEFNYPFIYSAVKETNTTGIFGLAIPSDAEPLTCYTFTTFILPAVGGFLSFYLANDSSKFMTLNLNDGTFTTSSPDIAAEVFSYPSGVFRVAFSFTTPYLGTATVIEIIHKNTGDQSPTRAGQTDRLIFTIARPRITKAGLNQPVLKDFTSTGSTSALVLNLERLPAPATLSKVVFTIALNLYPRLNTTLMTDTAVFNFGVFSIVRDQVNLYVKYSNAVLFTSPILRGLNVISVSYSPDTIIFKDLANPRQTVTGTYTALSTQYVTLGPCEGYLKSIALYAMADTVRCLEYLSNG